MKFLRNIARMFGRMAGAVWAFGKDNPELVLSTACAAAGHPELAPVAIAAVQMVEEQLSGSDGAKACMAATLLHEAEKDRGYQLSDHERNLIIEAAVAAMKAKR